MKKLISQLAIGIISILVAETLLPGVKISGKGMTVIETIIFIGITLGLINYFLKPVIDLVSLPVRILTFGLFNLIINMAIILCVDILFPSLIINGIVPLFWLALIMMATSFLVSGIIEKI